MLTSPNDILLTNLLYYFHFYNNWKQSIYRQMVTQDKACGTILIITENETKQTTHHRNVKCPFLINPTVKNKFKRCCGGFAPQHAHWNKNTSLKKNYKKIKKHV